MKSSLLLAGIVALAASAFAQPTKVGVINIQNAIVSTQDGQKAIKTLEEKSAPRRKDLEAKQGAIAALQNTLKTSSNTASEDTKRKLAGDIDAKTKSFNRDVEDAQAEAEADQAKLLNEIGGKMMAVIDKYATDKGYALVIDVSAQQSPVLYASNSVDITRDIVGLYDKNAPIAAGAPAPAPMPSKLAAPPATPPAKKTAPAK